MTDHQAIREDIAFMRQLAEAGGTRPMLGGAILVACGGIFGVASLATWWLARHGQGGAVDSYIWGGALLVYMAVLTPLLRALRGKTASPTQAAPGIAWSGLGLAIFFIVAGLGVFSVRAHQPDTAYVLPTVLMALYGAGWWIGAAVLRERWQYVVAAASFATAILTGWLGLSNDVFLVFGIALLGLMSLPGAIVWRNARAAADHG